MAEKRTRQSTCERKTKETDIQLQLLLDGVGKHDIHTGIGFFDHMLTAFAVHASLDMHLKAAGDLDVDMHHTVEDCGILLGQAIKEALGDKAGIARFGYMVLPMDDALARVALDLSGRPFLKYDALFPQALIGEYDASLTKEFFQALAFHGGVTLHIRLLEGENSHHACEAIFKAFAHAFKQAIAFGSQEAVLSSKGVLV